jgi:hypothetical protein
MNIGTSSFTVAITRCNIPYTDDIYRVTASSYSNTTHPVARRYIPGGYSPFSNQFSFNYFPPALSNNATYVNLTNLTPDTSYYYRTELKNKVSSNYVRIYNGLLASNFIRTNLPSGFTPNSNITFNEINIQQENYYNYQGVPINWLGYSNIESSNIYILNKNTLNSVDFLLSDILPIHTSNNTGSTSSNTTQINIVYSSNIGSQIQDITYSLRGYPTISCNYSIQNNFTKLSISSISDLYQTSSNFTGFYLKFSTIISLQNNGLQASPFPKQILYQQILCNYTYSNTTPVKYIDDISSSPEFTLNMPSFYSLSNNTTYVCGILCMSNTFISQPLTITNLYKNFITTDMILRGGFNYNLFILANNSDYIFIDENIFTYSNALLYTMNGNLIDIPSTYPLPSNIQIRNFSTILHNLLYSPLVSGDITFNFSAKNIIGESSNSISNVPIKDLYNTSNNLYWDNPSIITRNNTSCNTGPYGERMINYRQDFFNGGPGYIMPSDYSNRPLNEFLILLLGVPFNHTCNLVPPFPRSPYDSLNPYIYQIQLTSGYFIGPRYGLSFQNTYYGSSGLPIGYLNYLSNYGSVNIGGSTYTYPDYSIEKLETPIFISNPPPPEFPYTIEPTEWRWATFSYFFPKNSVNTINGEFMINIIDNNFQMDLVTQKLFTTSDKNDIQLYYKTFSPSSPISISNYDFNTVWMDGQEFINETINFGYLSSNTNRGINPGLLPLPFYTSNAIYENSSSNRILAIPPNVGTEDFYLLINIGFYYKSSGAFRYIKPIFN